METVFNISEWLTGAGAIFLVGIIVTFLRKKGWILQVKNFFGLASKITQEIGEAFMETSDAFGRADEMIKENGHLKENSVSELIKEGKEAILEWKDVVVIVKPK